MIISRGRDYIFVHIPKTGGTAMALALEDRAKADDILIGDTPKAVKRKKRLKDVQTNGRLWKHSRLCDVEPMVSRDEMERMFTFTLVRNPWNRVVSYYHWLQDQSFDHPAVRFAQTLPFDAFVNEPHTQSSLAANSYDSYMRDGAGTEHCSLYIRLERLAADMSPLVDHLGFMPNVPVANASKRDSDWRGYYNSQTRDLIGNLCASDILRFKYSFDC